LAIKTVWPQRYQEHDTGHLIAAAGATGDVDRLQACGTTAAADNQSSNPDPIASGLRAECRTNELRYALSNSFGFGGQNVALVVGASMRREDVCSRAACDAVLLSLWKAG